MSGRSTPWATAVLVLACAGLGAAVALELTGGLPIAPRVTAASPPGPAIDWSREPVLFDPPARDEFDEITARPLFSPTRRPVVGPVAAGPEELSRTPAPTLELVGILLTERQRSALLKPQGGAEPSWVREGERVEGWEIERIERDRVHVRAAERAEVVELRPDTATPIEARPKPRPREDRRQEPQRQQQAQDVSRADIQDDEEMDLDLDEIEDQDEALAPPILEEQD